MTLFRTIIGKVAIGLQSFADIRSRNVFYVGKTDFIREWWEQEDSVTLITRPRRFGKTLNLSMMECFFSNRYADSSGNGLINSLIQQGSADIKKTMELLLQGSSFEAELDEQIIFNQLDGDDNAVWSPDDNEKSLEAILF